MKRILLIGLLAHSFAIIGSAPLPVECKVAAENVVAPQPQMQPRARSWTVKNLLLGAVAVCGVVAVAHQLQSGAAKPAMPEVPKHPRSGGMVGFSGGSMYVENIDEVFTNPQAFIARAQKQKQEIEEAIEYAKRKAYVAQELNLNPDSFELSLTESYSISKEKYDEYIALSEAGTDPEELMKWLSDNSK